MKISIRILSLISALLLAHCSTAVRSEKKEDDSAPMDWRLSMRQMARHLETLSPFVFSSDEFAKPENKSTIRKSLTEFSIGTELIPKHVGYDMLGKDPLVGYSLHALKANSYAAIQAFNEGRYNYTRKVVQDSLGLCFNCHSSQNFGPQNNFSDTTLSKNFKMSASEKADFYIATRQYEKANKILESNLKEKMNILDNTQDQIDSLRKYLVLQVRVQKKPDQALKVLTNFANTHKLPYFLERDTQAWRKALEAWKNEKSVSSESFEQAQDLIRKAEAAQEHNGFQSGFIQYLRASEILHASLRSAKSKLQKSQMYELLGYSYEAFPEIGFWELPQIYYESCIRTSPKSSVARGCYVNFERALILGYSGSAGISIPSDERARMRELEVLSGY